MTVYFRELAIDTAPGVYEPAEDSFLLAENMGDYGGRVLDVGTGTGIVALAAAEAADEVVGVDVNPKAVELAARNAAVNGVRNARFLVGDLFTGVKERFDVIAFNPPYLPVSGEDAAWAGGEGGAEVIERFLLYAGDHLEKDGRIMLLVSSVNDKEKIDELIDGQGFTGEVAAKKKLFMEELTVLKLTYKP